MYLFHIKGLGDFRNPLKIAFFPYFSQTVDIQWFDGHSINFAKFEIMKS